MRIWIHRSLCTGFVLTIQFIYAYSFGSIYSSRDLGCLMSRFTKESMTDRTRRRSLHRLRPASKAIRATRTAVVLGAYLISTNGLLVHAT